MALTASALAVPADDGFDIAPSAGRPTDIAPGDTAPSPVEPADAEPADADAGPADAEPADTELAEACDLRRVPVPLCEPPFEDETGDARSGPAVRQETLALAFALPTGLPVSPVEPTGLAHGSHRRLQLVPPLESKPARTPARKSAKRKRTPEDDFGPRHTPRADLPEPKPWAGRLVQAIVEVTSGVRPVSQLVRWTTTDVYATMQRRIAHSELLSQRAAGGRRVGAIVRSIHIDEPRDGVAEVCAVVQHGARCRAIALRLEGFDGRWQCTALQVG
jgi:hypothetical protein